MSNVVYPRFITTLDSSPDRALEAAIGELESCVIVGYRKDGTEYFASSIAAADTVTWLLERCKHKLLTAIDDA